MYAAAGLLLVLTQIKISSGGYDCIPNCSCEVTVEYLFLADCSAENLTQVPEPYFKGKLDVLHLEFNQITIIKSGDFDHFDRLEVLHLRANGLEAIEVNAFSGLTSLRQLDLSENNLVGFPPRFSVGLGSTLTWFSVAKNSFSTFPPEISDFSELQFLDASQNSMNVNLALGALPRGLRRLKLHNSGLRITNLDGMDSLEYIDLSHCICKMSRDAFSNMLNLTTVLLANTNLTEPPLFATRYDSTTAYPIIHELHTMEASGDEETTLAPGGTTWHNPALRILDLSDNPRLEIEPGQMILPPFLVELNLARTNLRAIDEHFFGDALSVEYIDLSYSNLSSVSPHAFALFFNLTDLSLSGNPLESLPHLPGTLQKLSVSETLIRNLTSNMFSFLTNVVKANISNGLLQLIEDNSFGSMSSLEILDLSGNQIPTLKRMALSIGPVGAIPSLHPLSNLLQLDLSRGVLIKIEPGAFETHTRMTQLNLKWNKLDSIASGTFNGLESLEMLDLSENVIVDLPPGAFKGMTKLKILHLEKNRLEVIFQQTLNELESLEELYLEGNNLMTIHTAPLQSLLTLDVSNNSLSFFPEVLGDNLQNIDASQNPVKAIDVAHFKNLVNLENLNLSHCNLNKIDYKAAFRHTASLRTLDLTGNNIPNFFDASLPSLQNLFLADNNIKSINNSVKNILPNIKTLDIRNNYISHIDPSIFDDLTSLKMIDLSGTGNLACDCDMIAFAGWLDENKAIFRDAERYQCAGPPEYVRKLFVDTVKSIECDTPSSNMSSKTAIYIAVGIAAVVCAVLVFFLIRCLCKKHENRSNDHVLNSDGTLTVVTQQEPHCMCCKRCCFPNAYTRSRGRVISEDSRDLVEIMTSPIDKDAPISI